MNYLRAKQKRNQTITIGAVTAIVLFLMVIFRSPLAHAGKAVWNFVTWPVLQIDNFIRDRFSDAIISRASKRTLAEEIITLREQLRLAEEKNIGYEALKADHEALLGLSSNPQIIATVMRDPLFGRDTLILDQGSSDGVVVGDRVFASDQIVIGEISELFDRRSIVKLYSLSDVKTEAIILENGLAVTLSGRGGGNFEIMLPKDTVIAPGALVGLPDRASLVVGIVSGKISEEYDPFTKYIARLAVNPNELRFVMIKN